MSHVLRVWNATTTTRWHRHPELRGTMDDIAGHQHRVAMLAMMIFPDRPSLVFAALVHDMGECAIGDVPNPIKQRYPALKGALDDAEAEECRKMRLPSTMLTGPEKDMLRMCDKMDAYLWACLHRPDIIGRRGWPEDRGEIMELAYRNKCGATVQDILERALA
jgi:5'-deoxynucleotidase YfbR-like HD superfamily hydrolase